MLDWTFNHSSRVTKSEREQSRGRWLKPRNDVNLFPALSTISLIRLKFTQLENIYNSSSKPSRLGRLKTVLISKETIAAITLSLDLHQLVRARGLTCLAGVSIINSLPSLSTQSRSCDTKLSRPVMLLSFICDGLSCDCIHCWISGLWIFHRTLLGRKWRMTVFTFVWLFSHPVSVRCFNVQSAMP